MMLLVINISMFVEMKVITQSPLNKQLLCVLQYSVFNNNHSGIFYVLTVLIMPSILYRSFVVIILTLKGNYQLPGLAKKQRHTVYLRE